MAAHLQLTFDLPACELLINRTGIIACQVLLLRELAEEGKFTSSMYQAQAHQAHSPLVNTLSSNNATSWIPWWVFSKATLFLWGAKLNVQIKHLHAAGVLKVGAARSWHGASGQFSPHMDPSRRVTMRGILSSVLFQCNVQIYKDDLKQFAT